MVKAYINAFDHALRRKIEVLEIVSPQLAPKKETVAWDFPQGDAKQHFRHATAVKRGRINELHAGIQSHLHRAQSFVDIDFPELLAQR